ncbi:GNAT family N-acetyltransferase [Aristophania vespae]|uniref:GNAT family N-acetyltransferase n=1 Tax=Aristophania vespae TaxID=2697033 RepID=UPI0023518CD7|nr:GNAT family protein [Aristophania vespae]UMM63244.1 hypothetical protein DM15PD_02020 [Aristophania vespae]
MTTYFNEFNQPIGAALPKWKGAKYPDRRSLIGNYSILEPLTTQKHASELFNAYQEAEDQRDWTYLPYGPFPDLESYVSFVRQNEHLKDAIHYAVIDAETKKPVGTVALMRIDPANGVVEIGSVTYSRKMQRTRISTEVMALLSHYVFKELGYRRLEWKCNSFNAPSRAAALRFGFSFEGIFRQALVTKGRNRDTAWFSMLDSEYPEISKAYNNWLDPSNFNDNGQQKTPLARVKP